MEIKIKYLTDIPRLKQLEIGCWIDLYAAKTIEYEANEFFLIPLGVAMQLPEGYEALVAPRSSTFKKYKVLETNSPGVVDTSYCGDNDEWKMACWATAAGKIEKDERVCQMRIIESQPKISFVEVESLGNKDRGGFGSTGR